MASDEEKFIETQVDHGHKEDKTIARQATDNSVKRKAYQTVGQKNHQKVLVLN